MGIHRFSPFPFAFGHTHKGRGINGVWTEELITLEDKQINR